MSAQLLLVTIGRANTRGLVAYVFEQSSYYAYLIMPLLIVLGYALCARVGFDAIDRVIGPSYRRICVVVLVGLSLINAGKVYQIRERVRCQYPARPGILFARVDKLQLNTYYQCSHDNQYGIIMTLVGYAHLQQAIKAARLGNQPDVAATNMVIAARLIPLDQDFIKAIERDDTAEFEQALGYLYKARMAGNVHPLPLQLEHCKADLGLIGQYSAAITRMPTNAALYLARAQLYLGASSYARARRDIEQVLKLGGTVDQSMIEALGEFTMVWSGRVRVQRLQVVQRSQYHISSSVASGTGPNLRIARDILFIESLYFRCL